MDLQVSIAINLWDYLLSPCQPFQFQPLSNRLQYIRDSTRALWYCRVTFRLSKYHWTLEEHALMQQMTIETVLAPYQQHCWWTQSCPFFVQSCPAIWLFGMDTSLKYFMLQKQNENRYGRQPVCRRTNKENSTSFAVDINCHLMVWLTFVHFRAAKRNCIIIV